MPNGVEVKSVDDLDDLVSSLLAEGAEYPSLAEDMVSGGCDASVLPALALEDDSVAAYDGLLGGWLVLEVEGCVGPSLYEVTTSPIDLTFQALNIDDYSFTLDLKYDSVITQDVKVTFISGSQPPSTYTIPAYCNHLVFPIIIKAAHEPHYPTAEEIAGAVVEQISARLDVYNANLQQILHSVMDGLNNQSMVLVVITLGILITAAFLYRNLRSQKPKVEEEGEEPNDEDDDA